MVTINLIRIVLGTLLILYGLWINWLEKFKDMKYIDQKNGVLNGKVSILAGVIVSACSIKIGILFAVVSLVLFILEEIVLKQKLNKNK